MTSVFYDVIRLEPVRGRSNVLTEGHFWWFLGNLNPKMLSAIVWTPKRHFLTSQRVFWDISREIPFKGCFSRRAREKKERPYIWHILPGAPLRPIGTNFRLRVRLVDVINCAKFYRNRLRGLDFVGGSNFDHSHRNAMSPLTLLELTFPLWYEIVQFTFSVHKSDVDQRRDDDDNRQELKSTTSHDVTSTSRTLLVTAHHLHLRLGLI